MKVRKIFLQLVKEELDTIKVKAMDYEIASLDFDSFNHSSADYCIYGQMTGECTSDRAKELYPKLYDEVRVNFLCGYNEPTRGFYSKGSNFTPLEKYLFLVKSDKHLEVINYLKGEIDTIEINIP